MPVRKETEDSILAAIERIERAQTRTASDNRLVDKNLIMESKVSRATFYRSDAAAFWHQRKEASVVAAMSRLKQRMTDEPTLIITDQDLFREARIDAAAFSKMPANVLEEWDSLKMEVPRLSRRQHVGNSADRAIEALVSKLYGLTLALRKANLVNAGLLAEIERLGGNVSPIASRSPREDSQ